MPILIKGSGGKKSNDVIYQNTIYLSNSAISITLPLGSDTFTSPPDKIYITFRPTTAISYSGKEWLSGIVSYDKSAKSFSAYVYAYAGQTGVSGSEDNVVLIINSIECSVDYTNKNIKVYAPPIDNISTEYRTFYGNGSSSASYEYMAVWTNKELK